MIDTTGLNTSAAAGLRLSYGLPWNGSDPATFFLLTRLKSGGTNRDTLSLGLRQKIFQIGTDTASPQNQRLHIDLVNYGSGTRLRTILYYNTSVSHDWPASTFGLANWAALEDKWLAIAVQYAGSASPHQVFVGYHTGSAWNTYHPTTGGNTGANTYPDPTYYGFGYTSVTTNERQPYSDGNLFYQFHGETWDLATFDAVCESLIAADGTKKSIAGPINLVAEQRTGAAACHFVGPVRRPKSASFTTQKYFGETIANSDTVGACVKTTGLVDTTAVAFGTGSCSIEDPTDYGFTEDPEAVTPDLRARGQQGEKLRQIVSGTFTEQVDLVCIERSRECAARGFWLKDRSGLAVPLGAGESLDSTQYPSGEVAVGSGFSAGFGAHLWDKVIGTRSFMPQWGYTANSSSRITDTMVDVAATGGSYKTGSVLGSFEVANSIDQGAQRFGCWSNTAPSGSVVGRYAVRLAPGQKARYWFPNGGGMTPGNAYTVEVLVMELPGSPDINIRAMSHGEVTTSTTHPTGSGSPDWIGDAVAYPTATTTRGTNDNPTVDVDGTTITVPPADTTGSQPLVGDVVLLKGDNLSGRMGISVFDTAPDGSGNATLEHEFDTNNNGATLVTNPTLTWGQVGFAWKQRGVQLGEPDAHGPFKGIEVENPSGSGQDVFIYGWGCFENETAGLRVSGMGHGGNTYTNMYESSFTTNDETGYDPFEKLLTACGYDVAFVMPTYGAAADEADYIFERLANGLPSCEVYGGMGTRWPNDTFVTGGSGDTFRDHIYDNAEDGAFDVSGAYSGVYGPLMGMCLDDQHYSSDAVVRSAELAIEQLGTLELAPTSTGSAGSRRLHPQYRALMRRRLQERLGGDDDGQ